MQNTPSTDANIEQTWKRYLARRTVVDRNALVVHYADLVRNHAARLSRRLSTQVSYDDICSAGFDGLIEAVESYDPQRNTKFETFCQQRIFGAVMDWLRSLDPQSRTVRTFEKHRNRIIEQLDAENGHSPTEREIAERMNLDIRRYNDLSQLSRMGKAVHFSAMKSREDRGGKGSGYGLDFCDATSPDPAQRLRREMLAEYLSKGLTREERMTLTLYYYEDLTMAEIGNVLNLSESRVSQMHKSILAHLRERLGSTLAEELAA
ncbi:MAG: FliA/WhiG family RNA polymerase sigma factor [Phycisphaerae bacterium]|nr:FliA/WhiG family RNA polymerase sigma factor [Phycisphaerae bacterium]